MRMELRNLGLSKLAIITRDGMAYHEFIELNHLDESSCHRVRKTSDMINVKLKGFIIINPTPVRMNDMLAYLKLEDIPNLTRKYLIP